MMNYRDLTPQEKKEGREFLERLRAEVVSMRPILPLKVGVHEDVAARFPGTSVGVAAFALSVWAHRPRYLCAVAAGGPRYDLDGNEAGVVTDDQQALAKKLAVRSKHPKIAKWLLVAAKRKAKKTQDGGRA